MTGDLPGARPAHLRRPVLVPDTPPLCAEEIEHLPEGTRIRVIWSGGNGPHDDVIAIDRYGKRYAAMNDDPGDQLRWYNPLTFVGVERYHTRVWISAGAS